MRFLFYVGVVQVIALIFGLFLSKRLNTFYLLFLLQLILAVLFEAYGYYISVVLGEYNLWLFNIYILLEISLLTLAYTVLSKNKITNIFAAISLVMLVAFWVYSIYNYGINTLANIFYISGCILLVVLYFHLLFALVIFNSHKILKNPLFWICSSVLIYFGCFIPYKGIENRMISNDIDLAKRLFDINLGLNIIRYSLVAVAFHLYGTQAKRGYVEQ